MRLTEFLTIDRLIFPSILFPLSYYYVTRLVNIINQPANKINLKSCFMQIMSEVSCSYHSHTSIFAEYPNHNILQKFQTKVIVLIQQISPLSKWEVEGDQKPCKVQSQHILLRSPALDSLQSFQPQQPQTITGSQSANEMMRIPVTDGD